MRSHMEEVAKMFGVELRETFKIADDIFGKHPKYYRFAENVCLEASKDGVNWETADAGVLEDILIGDVRIIKLPWKPQEGDRYYFPCPASIEKWDYSTWSERDVDYYRLNHGFVCKTMERAVAISQEMLKDIRVIEEE